jgi:hypothetical protein
MADEFQAIRFVATDFRGRWRSDHWVDSDTRTYRSQDERNELVVIRETPAGTLVSYHYRIPEGEVHVVHDVAHVPARAYRIAEGDLEA